MSSADKIDENHAAKNKNTFPRLVLLGFNATLTAKVTSWRR